MFSNYFEKIEKQLLKKYKTKKTTVKKTAVKKTAKKSVKSNYSELTDVIGNIIPQDFTIVEKNIVDSSGIVSKGSDFIIAKNVYPQQELIFSEAYPAELVHGAGFVVPTVNRKNLEDVLNKVAEVKKLDQYSEDKSEPGFISTFIISFENTYTVKELKESIIGYYREHGIEGVFEFEIFVILGQGLIMKDWRNPKNFIALETGGDTLKWLYILMNEYLEMEKNKDLDLRAYVNSNVRYNEY